MHCASKKQMFNEVPVECESEILLIIMIQIIQVAK